MWDVPADEGGGDGIQRVQPVGQFDEAHEVGGDREARAIRAVVEDLDGGRPRVEVHVVIAIVHHRLAIGVVEIERRGGSLNRAADQVGWDARHLRLEVHMRAMPGQEVQRACGMYQHARVAQQVISLADDALNRIVGQELQTGSHGHVDSLCWMRGSI